MIVFMSVPSEHARSLIKAMPHGKMVVGYMCDDCLASKGFENTDIHETTLRNLWVVEKYDRWDDKSECFTQGLHLCRPHAIQRRWKTKEYRQDVTTALKPAMRKRLFETTGENLSKKERREERRLLLEKWAFDGWQKKELSFSRMSCADLDFLKHVSGENRASKKSGAYVYYPGLECWLAIKLDISENIVHKSLFEWWLSSQYSTSVDGLFNISINGLANGGPYNRYHGYVVYREKSISFSSSLELSFIVDCALNGDDIYRASDDKRFDVIYTYKGKTRKYYPDFIQNNSVIIEVKDHRELMNPLNIEKALSCLEQPCVRYKMLYRTIINDDISKESLRITNAVTAAWLERSKVTKNNEETHLG